MTDTISWLELSWIIMTLIGLCATSYNLYLYIGDWLALRQEHNYIPHGPRDRRIREQTYGESTRVVTMVGYLILGYIAATVPDRPDQWRDTRTLVFTGVLLLSAGLMAADAVGRIVGRRQVLEALEEQEQHKVTIDSDEYI